jgi:Mucin-2 protein WxxW repeating region/Ricin-type beta-trefoil lectin domain-like
MKTIFSRLIATLLAILFFTHTYVSAQSVEELDDYVATCKTELGFTSIPQLDCNDGFLFLGNSSPINDYVGHHAVNNDVDAVFACRWLTPFGSTEGFTGAQTVEMLVHNRKNGKTCFFASRSDAAEKAIIKSPTAADADAYWMQPAAVNSNFQCVGCHVAGPYIASTAIADELQKFGLLNDGHDTFVLDKNGNPVSNAFHVVGSTFSQWNDIVRNQHLTRHDQTCAANCHGVGYGSNIPSIMVFFSGFNQTLIPSLKGVINSFDANGEMPPRADDQVKGHSDYRWINQDTVDNEGDSENFVNAKLKFPELLKYCGEPGLVKAHIVGNNFTFSSNNPFPDKLDRFNLRDGLRCLNSQQADGSCSNYKTSYLCDGEWTGWLNRDSPNATGDHEGRASLNICESPTAIKAKTVVNGVSYEAYGPSDRLTKFDNTGLVCNNLDQPDDKCHNYVVHYTSCMDVPNKTVFLKSVWSNKVLTATNAADDSETRAQPKNNSWNSQKWVIEALAGRNYVRIKNLWTNSYLNAQANSENAKAVVYALDETWVSQHWIIEPIENSNEIRIKNAWSGKYLNVTDTSDYSTVLLKTLDNSWASQRWIME